MNKMIKLCMVSYLMLTSTMVCAGNMCSFFSEEAGVFLGLGGSFNSVKFKLDYSATGTGNVYDSGNNLVASGSAGGPSAPFSETQTTFAPIIHIGYYNHFKCSCNFWGIKYSYQYLDLTSIEKLIDTPQAGFLEPENESELSFTGNVITKSAQTKIQHAMTLLAFIGHSINRYKLYLGIGPSLFGTKSNIYQAFGFANLNGLPREATGIPVSFSSSKWVWGGTAQIGLSYLLNPCWILDFNYTYTISEKFKNHYSAPYETSLIGGYTNIGTLFINTKKQIRSQAFNVTINKKF